MSNLKNVSGELLAIAYLPAEDRNQALENLNIIIGAYPDSDISREQKELLQGIIEDLVKENTPTEGFPIKKVSKVKAVKKAVEQIEVVQPEIVKEEPKVEIVQPELSMEDIDDAF
jgi:hypothetical protein